MKFRKKPIVIEAKQWDGDWREMKEWANNQSDGSGTHLSFDMRGFLAVHTLEGRMKVELLDWVICGVKGEFYSCKPDIFKESYERAD